MSRDPSSLEERVQVLEDLLAVHDLLWRYAHRVDHHTIEEGWDREWIDCFAEDGVLEVRPLAGPVARRFHGRAELAAFMARHPGPPEHWHQHLMTSPEIRLDGGEATADSYFTRIEDDPLRGPYVYMYGRYRDRLRRCSDGRWRIQERVVEVQSDSPEFRRREPIAE